jgi:DnaJ-class molecular chaperone
MQIPPAITDTPAVRPCFWCNGSGRTPNDDEQRYDVCSACEGTGSRPAPQLAERIAA